MTTYSTVENFRQPILEYDSKTKLFSLVDEYIFEWEDRRIIISVGYEYDKASVPRLLWGIARPDGPWEAASLIHDYLYQHKGRIPIGSYESFNGRFWSLTTAQIKRSEADDLLEKLGVLGGAPKWQARLYKLAVQSYPINWFKGF